MKIITLYRSISETLKHTWFFSLNFALFLICSLFSLSAINTFVLLVTCILGMVLNVLFILRFCKKKFLKPKEESIPNQSEKTAIMTDLEDELKRREKEKQFINN